MTETILLFGASGRTGRHVLDLALERGLKVRAAEREFPADLRSHPALETRTADLLEGDLDPLMDGVSCVISAAGLARDPRTMINPPPLYTQGAVNIIKAMRRTGLKRFVTISAAFADRQVNAPLWFLSATSGLQRIFTQMAEMERVLSVCEDIEWTAVRPGWLLNRERTGDFEVSLDNLPKGKLRTRRADLAQFMLDCALDAKHIHQRPFLARKESVALETPPALIEELLPF